MKTSKTFSTISYNSSDFLTVKLSELVNRRKIAFWAFFHHLPEEDEEKEHKHLYIVPNGQVNTDEIREYLLEFDPVHPDKPLGCIPCRSSKFYDWYMYSLHDEVYLASKGQSRKYRYTIDDCVCSDKDYLNEEIHQMDMSHLSKVKALKQAVDDNVPFEELLSRGQIPVQQVYAYQRAYSLMQDYKTNRNERVTHSPKFDPDTGELLSNDSK